MVNKLVKSVLFNLSIVIICAVLLVAAFYFFCIRMPGQSYSGPLPETTEELENLAMRLHQHVYVLAGEIGERNYGKRPALEKAADYIEEQFKSYRYVPKTQIISNKGFRNIVVDLYGKQYRDEIIVVGAHYDTAWMTPGADDNASGVAALLEIARMLNNKAQARSIRFVAFVNEEWPFFGGEEMGSRYHAKRARESNENIIGMFSLEMLGYYSDEPKSQYLPRPIRPFYPRTGDFIAFVSNVFSRSLLVNAIAEFRENSMFPSQGLAAPQWLVRAVRRSDNSSFWAYAYPAVMITDTANFRNWAYHNAADKHDTLDYDRMARVVNGVTVMLERLASQ